MKSLKFLLFILLMLGTALTVFLLGFTLPTEIALTVLILAVISDFLTTYLCMRKNGKEGNPMVGFLFKKIGLLKSFAILAGIWVLIIVFRVLPAVALVQTAIAISYWLIPVNNVIVLVRLQKKQLKLKEAS